MAQFFLMLVLGLGLTLFPQNIFAEEGHDHTGASDAAVETIPSEGTTEVGNMICPVSGEKVGEMGEAVKYEYNGKIYNLCCPMCKKDFDKDPEKFSKKVEDQMVEEQTIEGEIVQ